MDASGTHGLSCRFSTGCHARHAAINDIIKRSPDSAKVPSHLEPLSLSRLDGKRPDRATVVPWREGRALVWDATCSDTLALSHITLATSEGGAVASDAERRKHLKHTHLDRSLLFIPVAIETLGVLGSEAKRFLRELARRIEDVTNEPLSHQFLLQRLAVAVQRGSVAAVMGSARVWKVCICVLFVQVVLSLVFCCFL